MELSIDTSTRFASVGLSRGGDGVAELNWRSERNQSVELAPTIRELMKRAGLEMGDLEAVFVARGPGGFSAVRVGISTAKTMAAALGTALVSVPTLDVEAHPYMSLGIPVRSVIGAGRDRVYLGSYEAAEGPQRSPRYDVVTYDVLASEVDETTLFCGEGVRAVAELLRERLGSQARIADVPPPTRRASVLAYLAHCRWRAGEADDPATLQPMYLRASHVDTAHRTWVGSRSARPTPTAI